MHKKLWDLGLFHGAVLLEFSRSCAGYHWHPGLLEGLQLMALSKSSVDFHRDPVHHIFQSLLGLDGFGPLC
jgi:hypothetical protein